MEVIKQEITDTVDWALIRTIYEKNPPLVAAFDTETDGRHIINSRPFVYQFGWYNEDLNKIWSYAIDLERHPELAVIIDWWHELVKEAPVYVGQNVKFDLHMIHNIDYPYTHNNLSDTMFYIRFAHDNVSARQGGVKLGLKDYTSKYIDPKAKYHDKEIQHERSQIAKHYNRLLKETMGWSMKRIDEFFKDDTNISLDFPSINCYSKYLKWKSELPPGIKHTRGKIKADDVPYTLVPRELLMKYALDDIEWTIKVYLQTYKVVEARRTDKNLALENDNIYPLFRMERQGLPVDKQYVDESFHRMRTYIRQRRQDLKDAIGEDITCNQHKRLLEYFNSQGININSTGNAILDVIPKNYPDHPALHVVELIQELRTLEKWFSTYLMRFKGEEKIYTQINQVGAASLRMSSDFQQFPKKGLKTVDGQELFNPRRAIKAGRQPMVYLDYSQIELRLQALYTILVGNPDLNLCRAYMPYRCVRGTEEFDYNNPEHLRMWDDPGWTLKEDPESKWTPTDVHGATAKAAFNIDESHPRYTELRYLGKTVNFAKNFGAQRGKIAEMFPHHDSETIDAIDRGYYDAFPGVRDYQSYCYKIGDYQPFATNLFGLRYWNVSGHNLINMLIQGSAATLLKLKIVKLDEFLKDYKTTMVIPVHDEIQFSMPEEELYLVPQLIKIMERWDDSLIPIVTDAEITRTYWSEKEDYNAT